jgi:succinate dehydrogenase / fumarate reductase flavoprotein subunit
VEHATPEGECARNDDAYCYAAAWEYHGVDAQPSLHKEHLTFNDCKLGTRSYK